MKEWISSKFYFLYKHYFKQKTSTSVLINNLLSKTSETNKQNNNLNINICQIGRKSVSVAKVVVWLHFKCTRINMCIAADTHSVQTWELQKYTSQTKSLIVKTRLEKCTYLLKLNDGNCSIRAPLLPITNKILK